MPDRTNAKLVEPLSTTPASDADRAYPDHVPSCIEKCSQCGCASIVERLAAPGAADTEFETLPSGRLFRAADFS